MRSLEAARIYPQRNVTHIYRSTDTRPVIVVRDVKMFVHYAKAGYSIVEVRHGDATAVVRTTRAKEAAEQSEVCAAAS